jgi:hypothetical protein
VTNKILEYRGWRLTKLESVCELPEEGLRCPWVRQTWGSLCSGEIKKPWLRNGQKPVVVRISTALLGGRQYPFIGPRAWFTMHCSWACLNHIYEQSISWNALGQPALEGSYVRSGMATCLLCYGCHVVAWWQGSCESLSTHWHVFLIKTQKQKTARALGCSCTAWPGCTLLTG